MFRTLDEVPDVAERRLDDGALDDRGGSGNGGGRHVLRFIVFASCVVW